MDWKIISSRRKFTLESFLSDVLTEKQAADKFSSQGITNPPMDEVRRILESRKPVVAEVKVSLEKEPDISLAPGEPQEENNVFQSSSFLKKLKKTKNLSEEQ